MVSRERKSPLSTCVEDGQPLSGVLLMAPRIDSKVMASRMMNMIMILSTSKCLTMYENAGLFSDLHGTLQEIVPVVL